MDIKSDSSKYWREFKQWQFWLHTIIVDIILAGIWFGVNTLINLMPIIRDIGFLVLIIAGLFAVAWYLPKISFKRQKEILAKDNIEVAVPRGIEFYRTREELTKVRGKMKTELKNTTKIWIATWTGKYFDSEKLLDSYHIDRLVILDSKGNYVESHLKATGEQIATFEKHIDTIKEIAKRASVSPKFADFPIMDALIVVDYKTFKDESEFSDDAWIRIETAIPFNDPNNCPNFVIYKKNDVELFQALVDHFNRIWILSNLEQTQAKKALPAWIDTALKNERDHLADRIIIVNRDYRFNLNSTEPYILVDITILNSAIYPILVTSVKGSLIVVDTKCNLPALKDGDGQIRFPCRHSASISIRQPITKETADKIASIRDKGKEFSINLRECYFIIKSEEPDYDLAPINVRLGENYEIKIFK